MALLTKVRLNGTTIRDDSDDDAINKLISWEYERTSSTEISEMNIRALASVEDSISLTVGNDVEVWQGFTTSQDTKVFTGYISEIKSDGGVVKITCKDKMWDLVRKNVNTIYEDTGAQAGQISEIAKDLIETYGGLTADVEATGTDTGETISEFRCNNTDIWERLVALATAVNYQIWYDAVNDTIHFEPKGFNDTGTTLTVGTEIIGVPRWKNDTSKMVNDLRVDGAVSETQTRKPTGTGTGLIGTTSGFDTTGILLDFTPETVQLIMDASNPPTTVKVGGSKDSSTSNFFYIDQKNKKVLPSSGTTFTSGHYAIVNYTWMAPSPVHQSNQLSIDAYGKFEKQITLEDVTSVLDAEARTSQILSYYSEPFLIGELFLKVDSTLDFNVGDKVTIVDAVSKPNINQKLAIVKQTLKYPGSIVELTVGDESIRLADWQLDVETRLKRIEELLSQKNQDIILELFDFKNSKMKLKPRYRKVITETMSDGSNFILGHPDMGVLGTDVLGRQADASTDYFVSQYQNKYIEEFVDSDFESSNTTAAWGSGECAFSINEIAESKPIDYNNGTITSAKLTSTAEGDYSYEMAVSTTVPEAHYKLNDNATNTDVIESISAVTATANVNTNTLTTTGKINEAFLFDGDTTKIDTNGNIFGTGDMSISLWINATSAGEGGYGRIIDNGTQRAWIDASRQIVFQGDGSTMAISATSAITFGVWHHIVITRSSTGVTNIYVDNSLSGSADQSSGTPGVGSTNLFIGNRSTDTRGFDGKFDDIRIYTSLLNSSDRTTLYNSGSGTEGVGGGFESVTNGVVHTFANTGTDLRWRATLDSAGDPVIWEYAITGDDHQYATYDTTWNAQTFTMGTLNTNENRPIDSVKLKLYRTGSPGTVNVAIKAVDGNNKPTGADLSTGTTDGDTLTDTSPGEWREVSMSAYTLVASTQYAIVIKATSGDILNRINWRYDTHGNDYTPYGELWISFNSGSTWFLDPPIGGAVQSHHVGMFEVYVDSDESITQIKVEDYH